MTEHSCCNTYCDRLKRWRWRIWIQIQVCRLFSRWCFFNETFSETIWYFCFCMFSFIWHCHLFSTGWWVALLSWWSRTSTCGTFLLSVAAGSSGTSASTASTKPSSPWVCTLCQNCVRLRNSDLCVCDASDNSEGLRMQYKRDVKLKREIKALTDAAHSLQMTDYVTYRQNAENVGNNKVSKWKWLQSSHAGSDSPS